jgi:hypothetical protein
LWGTHSGIVSCSCLWTRFACIWQSVPYNPEYKAVSIIRPLHYEEVLMNFNTIADLLHTVGHRILFRCETCSEFSNFGVACFYGLVKFDQPIFHLSS